MDQEQAARIEQNIKLFRGDLLKHNPLDIVRNHVLQGSCFAHDQPRYFELRSQIASHFSVHPNEVVVVGSAKLGFSIAPHKQYHWIRDDSDIDAVIVSPSLYSVLWRQVLEFEDFNGPFELGVDFRDYHFQGWIRPDKLPAAPRFPLRRDWWEFFRKLSGSGKFGNRPINGALYQDWFFVERYQKRSVLSCQQRERQPE